MERLLILHRLLLLVLSCKLEHILTVYFVLSSRNSLLLIEFVAASDHKVDNAIARKDKKKLPLPVRPH